MKTKGFTLVELLVAMVAASVLAITAGIMIFAFFKGVKQSREAVDLQRDGAAAMAFFNQWIRETSIEGITTTPTSLTISNDTPVVISRFYATGKDLRFDPNIAVPDNDIRIIEGRLESFTPNKDSGTSSVTIDLVLASGETREAIRARLKPRN